MKTRKEYKDYYLNKLLKKFGEFTERDYNSAHEFCYREEWDLGNNINAIDGLGDAWIDYEKRYNNGVQPIEPIHPVNPVKKDPPRPDDKDKQQSGKKGNKNNQPQPNSDKRPGVGENYDGYANDESDITSSPYMDMRESDMIISGYDRNAQSIRDLFSSSNVLLLNPSNVADKEIGSLDLSYDSFDWFDFCGRNYSIHIDEFLDWLKYNRDSYKRACSYVSTIKYITKEFKYDVNRAAGDLKFYKKPLTIENLYNQLIKRECGVSGFDEKHNLLYFVSKYFGNYAYEISMYESSHSAYIDSIGLDKNIVNDAMKDYIDELNNKNNVSENDHDPFKEGYDAYMRDDRHCPYKQGTPDFDSWVDGWQEAEMDMEP